MHTTMETFYIVVHITSSQTGKNQLKIDRQLNHPSVINYGIDIVTVWLYKEINC